MAEVHLFIIPEWIILSTSIGTQLLAFWKGDWRTRVLATYCLFSFVFEMSCNFTTCWDSNHLPRLAWRWLAQDLIALGACFVCVRRADRYWVIWASSIRLAMFATDLLGLYRPLSSWAYVSAAIVWVYLFDASILWGTWEAIRSRRAARRVAYA